MEGDEIKEVFFSPMSLKDLRSASLLQKHFEESHSDDRHSSPNTRDVWEGEEEDSG